MPTTARPLPPQTLPNTRLSRPPNLTLYGDGDGLHIIPRQGFAAGYGIGALGWGNAWEAGALATRGALLNFAAAYPGRLSEILGTTHPTVSKAQSNWLAAAATSDDVKLIACRVGAQDGQEKADDGATARLNKWLDSLPGGLGGLKGLRTIGGLALLHYGMFPIEAVVGKRGTGVARIGMVDAPSVLFKANADGDLLPYQYQSDTPQGVPLNLESFFWATHYASATNPYGIAVFSAAVAEALADFARQQDINDSLHNAAWQRYVYQYSLEALYRIATMPKEGGGLGLPVSMADPDTGLMIFPAQEWVNSEITQVMSYLAGLKPDDNMVADSSGDVKLLAAASFEGIEGILESKDYRLIRALDELPTLMAMPKAGAQTYTTVEAASQATKYETLREEILSPIIKAANLHFQYLGEPFIVRAECEALRRTDAVQDANAEAVDAKTWRGYWVDGLITKEEYAMHCTGSPPPKNDPNAYQGPEPGQNADLPQNTPDNADLPNGGTTQEDRDAAKQGKQGNP